MYFQTLTNNCLSSKNKRIYVVRLKAIIGICFVRFNSIKQEFHYDAQQLFLRVFIIYSLYIIYHTQY